MWSAWHLRADAAEDFGKRLGVGAHLAALRRTRANFHMRESVTLDQLEKLSDSRALSRAYLARHSNVRLSCPDLNAADVQRVRHS